MLEATLNRLRDRHISLMHKTLITLDHILADVSQEEATTYRDGGDGWTVLEVLCHLRDFDGIFYGRAVMMLEQDAPTLKAYDHEALVEQNEYSKQNLVGVLQSLHMTRERFIAFFKDLKDADWSRTGEHPESGTITLLDALVQVGTHEADHIEQITRILKEGRAAG